MVDVAMVRMFGMPVGTFRWDGQYEIARFEYDRSYVGLGLEPSPLMMPVREGRIYSFAGLDRETFKGLPGMLADYGMYYSVGIDVFVHPFPWASNNQQAENN